MVLQGEESDITDKGMESSAMVRVMLFSSLSQDQTPQDEVSADCTLLLSYRGQTLLKFILSSDIIERGMFDVWRKTVVGLLDRFRSPTFFKCVVKDAVNWRDLIASVAVELICRTGGTGGIILTHENRSTRRKTRHRATMFTVNVTYPVQFRYQSS